MKVYTFSITVQDVDILRQVPFVVEAERISDARMAVAVAILGSNCNLQQQRDGYVLGPSRLVSIV